jgi:nucleotide-binding universal stress UspA family protein
MVVGDHDAERGQRVGRHRSGSSRARRASETEDNRIVAAEIYACVLAHPPMACGRASDSVCPTKAAAEAASGRKEPVMFETIVWATDGSEEADRALPLVTELARAHNSKVVAVHANEILVGRFGGAPLLADEEDIRAKIEKQVAELREAGVAADVVVETGGRHGVADLIVDAATKADADLIVVGTHGRGAAATAVLGSVAKDLLHRAHCPVLVSTAAGVKAATVG